jgi:hypothetical protein
MHANRLDKSAAFGSVAASLPPGFDFNTGQELEDLRSSANCGDKEILNF